MIDMEIVENSLSFHTREFFNQFSKYKNQWIKGSI